MVNLLQTQYSLMNALDLAMSLEEKLSNNVIIGEDLRLITEDQQYEFSRDLKKNTPESEEDEKEASPSNSDSYSSQNRKYSSNSDLSDLAPLESEERLYSKTYEEDEESSEETINEGGSNETESSQELSVPSKTQTEESKGESSFYTARRGDTSQDQNSKIQNTESNETGSENSDMEEEESETEESGVSESVSESQESGVNQLTGRKLLNQSVFPSKVKDPKTHLANVRFNYDNCIAFFTKEFSSR